MRTLSREILIDQFDVVDVVGPSHKAAQSPRLTEERIELPKLLLLPLIERMVMALRALNLQPQENLRYRRRCLHPVLLVDLHRQEVRRTVEVLRTGLGRACRGDQLMDHRVVRLVARKTVSQVLLHPLATRQRSLFHSPVATDQDIGPYGRPMVRVLLGVLIVLQEPSQQIQFAIQRLVLHEHRHLFETRYAPYHIQIDPTAPLQIVFEGRRTHPCIGPTGLDRLIDLFSLNRNRRLAIGLRSLVLRKRPNS